MPLKQALSIGINSYSPSHLALRPCIHDATDLHHSLRSIGFQSEYGADLNLNAMKSATHRFVKSIRPGAVVLFYFSGHGVQSDGNNYLVPANATGICADNIKSTAIDAQKLINDMHSRHPRLVICILDCCRTDPPTEPLDASSFYKRALAGTRPGFAPMRAPSSTIVVYACAADDTASPNSKNGRNSLYTYHLLRYIKTPNTDIETVLRYVAADVQKDSAHEQIPFRYSSCNEMICLVGKNIHNAPMSPHVQAKHLAQPLYPTHQKALSLYHPHPQQKALTHYQPHSHQKALSLYHPHSHQKAYHNSVRGHFGTTVHRRPTARHALLDMQRTPSRFGPGSPRDLWYY
ncbi:unnamed protein product [Adineta steineri]|uniref:Peptidase C14 caspase domain-containing protein n=1 Tax=Adineta steineri TaxID=433720 RepID=A0A814W9R6_9BILA|nr:unnamed protein product [Adineta steineri]CAF1198363.1 unnamed protein product [Adineta steineri]CAF3547487.1 unnamed protein product [Adineta steineri]CAF3727525.1 unnamed protein product [Adineta steineri]